MPSPSSPDIDRIIDAIRAEARARGSRAGPAAHLPARGSISAASHGMPSLPVQHVADFLALPLDAFIDAAYRHILGREPDAEGAGHYQRALLRGRLTRIEMLGRLHFSPEGRMRGSALPGVAFAFILATCYRVPVAGPLLALAARALRLPAHWQDRSVLEATALASGAWMRR